MNYKNLYFFSVDFQKNVKNAREDGIPDIMIITPERYLGYLDFISLDEEGIE